MRMIGSLGSGAVGGRFRAGVLIVGLALLALAVACGGGEEGGDAPGAVGAGSPEEQRIATLEARAQSFEDFMVAQTLSCQASGEDADGEEDGGGHMDLKLAH